MYVIKIIKKIKNKIINVLRLIIFDNNLSNNGERTLIRYGNILDYILFNNCQKTHYNRYKFAEKFINSNMIVGDFACGTGYGSVIISKKAKELIGIDIDKKVIDKIKNKYTKNSKNIKFICKDLTKIKYYNKFDCIISFETIEHLKVKTINTLLKKFNNALKNNGILLFSVPYNQKRPLQKTYHETFNITSNTINSWMKKSSFEIIDLYYQSYDKPQITKKLKIKDFILCIAKKNKK